MEIAHLAPPPGPLDVVIVGSGRVGGAFASALARAGHTIVAAIRRADALAPVSRASLIVVSVPDDALPSVAAGVARAMRPGAVVIHTCGLEGLDPLRGCGPFVAAVHPAHPIATAHDLLDGVLFGVTCEEPMREWCTALVADLGGVPRFIDDAERARYHAALVMASNFAVTLAGDAADLLGGLDAIVPLMRRTVENIASLGPDGALTGPVVRGDVGTIRRHLLALPPALLESYVANARRAVARAVAAGRLGDVEARAIGGALEEALVR